MRILPCGDGARLVEVDDLPQALALADALDAAADRIGVADLVPAARTVLVILRPGTSPDHVESQIRALALEDREPVPRGIVEVAVRYDGPDLEAVAAIAGLDVPELIAAHTGQLWRSAFIGFAPGFSYLVGDGIPLNVPRRDSPRPRVPAGAVGLAGEFCGIYPRETPGGWQLIGHTDAPLWDATRSEPALLPPGTGVRFTVAS